MRSTPVAYARAISHGDAKDANLACHAITLSNFIHGKKYLGTSDVPCQLTKRALRRHGATHYPHKQAQDAACSGPDILGVTRRGWTGT